MKAENESQKNRFIAWCKDYQSDFKKIIFSFLMGYSSVIVVVLISAFMNEDFFKVLSSKSTLYSILGCCSSMLAVASVPIEKNMPLKMTPMLFNILAILPIFALMSYFVENDSIEINIGILTTITIMGVIISFYYLVISTNEERTKRKKFEDLVRDSKILRSKSEKTTQGSVAGTEFDV
ncbi:hypothetical protein [Bacillus hominis]|uniref:hypothetical protein n=1 Tax=Bacillus hominis TaxID=2817478 RepID=UPI001BB45201|nr:hypothetical protein [Bacillus hominis]